MRIDDLLVNARSLLGAVVEVEGYFVFVDEEGFVVAAPEKRTEKSEALKIDVQGLKQLMLARVPPLGGGKYYYLHQAAIKGRLSTCSNGEFPYELVDVESLQVEVSGEWFCAVP